MKTEESDDVFVVLKAGIEGGSITLYGKKVLDGEEFALCTRDQTPAFFDCAPEIRGQYGPVSTWSEALKLLERYQWHQFFALKVHPDFSDRVWQAVQQRSKNSKNDEDILDRWRMRCFVGRKE